MQQVQQPLEKRRIVLIRLKLVYCSLVGMLGAEKFAFAFNTILCDAAVLCGKNLQHRIFAAQTDLLETLLRGLETAQNHSQETQSKILKS